MKKYIFQLEQAPEPYTDIIISINSENFDLFYNYLSIINDRINSFSQIFKLKIISLTPIEYCSIIAHVLGPKNCVFNSFYKEKEENMDAIVISELINNPVITYNQNYLNQIERILLRLPVIKFALMARMNSVLYQNILVIIDHNIPLDALVSIRTNFNRKSTLILCYSEIEENTYKGETIDVFAKKVQKNILNLGLEKNGQKLYGFNISKSKIYSV